MKTIIIILCFIQYLHIHAQNTLNNPPPITLGISISPTDMDISIKKKLESILTQIATKNGITVSDKTYSFSFNADINIINKDITPTAPPMHSYSIEIYIRIIESSTGKKMVQETIKLKGIGETETKAMLSALKKMNTDTPIYKSFFETAIVQMQDIPENTETEKTYTYTESDVDIELPTTTEKKENAIAVVIGNTDYKKGTGKVKYAIHDARTFKKYLIHIFGFLEENIIYKENATLSDFYTLFGSPQNPSSGKLYKLVKENETEVFIFYAGHGAPKNKENYFIPVDADIKSPEVSGYSLSTFQKNISLIPAKYINIILDACFSGSNITEATEGISGFKTVPVSLEYSQNVSVFASSTGEQVSTWYDEKQHGLFTYYFLKGIQTKDADINKNGEISYQELKQYLTDPDKIPFKANILHNQEQTPSIQIYPTKMNDIFLTYKKNR